MSTQIQKKQQLINDCLKSGFVRTLQNELRLIIEAVSKHQKNSDLVNYYPAIGMFYILAEDGRLEELNTMMAIAFPEYFELPEHQREAFKKRLEQFKEAIENGSLVKQLFINESKEKAQTY